MTTRERIAEHLTEAGAIAAAAAPLVQGATRDGLGDILDLIENAREELYQAEEALKMLRHEMKGRGE